MKSHRTDRLSLGFGLVFLAAVAWWLVGRHISVELRQAGWVVAVALIAVGALGLAGTLRSGRNRDVGPEVKAPEELT